MSISAFRIEYKRALKSALILFAMYIACQIIADIAAVKIAAIGIWTIPAGTFVYAVTFTVRDALHRRHGVEVARLAVWTAAVINVAMAVYFIFTEWLPPAVFWGDQEAYMAILGVVPFIVFSSIVAELLSELLDTNLYQWAWDTFAKNSHVARVVFSNAISIPVDSILFAGLAFLILPSIFPVGHALSLTDLGMMVAGQSIFKWATSLVVLPLTSLIGRRE